MALDGNDLGQLMFDKLDDDDLVSDDDQDMRDACLESMQAMGRAIVEHLQDEAEVTGIEVDTSNGEQLSSNTGDVD